MPQFTYRGRDNEGQLRAGDRFATSADDLNNELIKEGISPIHIELNKKTYSFWRILRNQFQGKRLYLEELGVFCRQMQLLHEATVPMTTALEQLSRHTRSYLLSEALRGVIDQLEKGHNLATAMQQYPDAFSPLMISIIEIGESTGHLSEAFAHLHQYLEFESSHTKEIRSALRYPLFVLISSLLAIIVLNIFVIPTFAKFYSNLTTSLPWETVFLIGMSNFTVNYGIYFLIFAIIAGVFLFRYLKTPKGKYRWNKLEIQLPVIGKILKRINLIRFSQSLSIMLESGIPVTQCLVLAKNVISNSYLTEQISQAEEAIERGVPLTQALVKIEIFTPLEIQILAVGEKNGELSSALNYISSFQNREIEFDLKRMSDLIGPILIGIVSGLILIISLGVYLPIWNMINLVH